MNEVATLEPTTEIVIPDTPGTDIQVRLGDESLAIDLTKPSLIFREGGGDPILDKIKDKLAELSPTIDISTPKGRTAVNSIVRNVGSLAKSINESKLIYTEKLRLAKAQVDAEGKRISDSIKAMQDEFRKPLADWEAKQEARRAEMEACIVGIQAIGQIPASSSSDNIREAITKLESVYQRDWDEFALKAKSAFTVTSELLASLLKDSQDRETRRAEEQQRKLAEQLIAKKEREDLIARVAAQKAQEEAEAKAAALLLEAETAAQRAAEKAERELQDRIASEIEAKRQAELAEQRIKDLEAEKVASAERAKKAAADAKAKAKRDQEAAVQRERDRTEAVHQAALKEAADRAADEGRCTAIQEKAVKELAALFRLVPADAAATAEDMAEMVVTAIAFGKIPNVTINY